MFARVFLRYLDVVLEAAAGANITHLRVPIFFQVVVSNKREYLYTGSVKGRVCQSMDIRNEISKVNLKKKILTSQSAHAT